MSDPFRQLPAGFQQSIVGVLDNADDGSTIGTGFVVGSNLLLTCAHVVLSAGSGEGQDIIVRFEADDSRQIAHVELADDQPMAADRVDVAILRLKAPLPALVKPLALGESTETLGHPFATFGFPALGSMRGIHGDGTIDGSVHNEHNQRFLQLDSRKLERGMSGAPILDTLTSLVVGMVTRGVTRAPAANLRDLKFALPAETLAHVCSELELHPTVDIRQLIQIAEARNFTKLLSRELQAHLRAAIVAQTAKPAGSLVGREAVADVLAMLRSKNALYASLDNEIWEYVFASLHELRAELSQASSRLLTSGPLQVQALIDLMVEAVREYLGRYESPYLRFMAPRPHDWGHERQWPQMPAAARDLLLLRDLLLAAIAPLNAYAAEGEIVEWDRRRFTVRNYQVTHSQASSRTPDPNQPQTAPTLSELVQALKSDLEPVRLAAAETLAARRDSGAVAALIDALNDEEPIHTAVIAALQAMGAAAVPHLLGATKEARFRVRYGAVSALSKTMEPAAVEALVTALGDDAPAIQKQAYSGLKSMGRVAGPQLIDAVRRTSGQTRMQVASLLEQIRDPAAVPALRQALDEPDPQARAAVVRALGRSGGADAVPDLLPLLSDPDEMVRKAADFEIYYIGSAATPDLVAALESPSTALRIAAAQLLGRKGDERATAALSVLLHDRNPDVRLVAVTALGQRKYQEAAPALRKCLQDPVAAVREAAVEALWACAGADERQSFLQAVRDRDAATCAAAAQALGWIGDPAAVALLVDALQRSGYSPRHKVIEALGKIGSAEAVPALLDVLQDPEALLRLAAAQALTDIGDRNALPALTAALRDPDGFVRSAAVRALAKFQDAQAVPHLLAFLEVSEDWMDRDRAVRTLGIIGDPTAVPAIIAAMKEEAGTSKRNALYAIQSMGRPAVPALVKALDDTDSDMRHRVLTALGEIGDPAAVPALRAIAAEADQGVQRIALAALRKIEQSA